MKHTHVIYTDLYASGITTPGTTTISAVASLAKGSFCVFNKDPDSADFDKSMVLSDATTTLPIRFQIVSKNSKGELKWSPIIYRDKARATILAVVAGTAKVVYIGEHSDGDTTNKLNLPTIEEGDIAGITVINPDKGPSAVGREKNYTYTCKTGDTEDIIVTALIALINADTNKIVTATITSGATKGFYLTGAAGQVYFVAPVGIFRNSTIATTTEVVLKVGTGTGVLNMEKFDAVERGADNLRMSELYTSALDAVSTSSYKVLMIKTTNPNERPFNGGDNEEQTIVVAVLSTLTTTDTYCLKAIDRIAAII